jgi:hypothetical protein
VTVCVTLVVSCVGVHCRPVSCVSLTRCTGPADHLPFACTHAYVTTPFDHIDASNLRGLPAALDEIKQEMAVIAARHSVLMQHLAASDIPICVLPLSTKADFERQYESPPRSCPCIR